MNRSLLRKLAISVLTLAISTLGMNLLAQRGGGPAIADSGARGGSDSSSTKSRSDSTRRSGPFSSSGAHARPTRTDSPASRLVDKGNDLVAKSQFDEAIGAYSEAARLKPNYFDALYGLGWALNETQKYQDAVNALKRALAVEPQSPTANFEIGFAYRNLKQYDESFAAFRAAIAAKPDNAEAFYQLGWIENDRGRYAEAEKQLVRATKIKPQYAEAYVELGYSLKKLERFAEAERAFRQAVVIKPGYSTALIQLGDLYFYNLKDYKQAAASYEAGLPADTDNATALYNEGWSFNDQAEYTKALAALEKGVSVAPTDSRCHVELGYAYRKLGEAEPKNSPRASQLFTRSISSYKESIRLNPESASAYTGLGDVEFYDTLRYAEAVPAYANSIRLAGDKADPRVLYNAGWAYNDLKRYREAIVVLQRATTLKPEYAEAYFELGFAYRQQKNYESAVAAYSEAIRLKPDYGPALYQLGGLYNDTTRYSLALPLLQRAVRIMPTDAAAGYELGFALLQMKQYNEAIQVYRAVLRIKPDHVAAHYDLGVALVAVNKRREATDEYQALQDLDRAKAEKLLLIINGRN